MGRKRKVDRSQVTVSTSVSHPAWLRDEMDKYDDVSWSDAAREGIERRLAQLSSGENGRLSHDAAISRLRTSRKELEGMPRDLGRETGTTWALNTASFDDLTRLERRSRAFDWEKFETDFESLPKDYPDEDEPYRHVDLFFLSEMFPERFDFTNPAMAESTCRRFWQDFPNELDESDRRSIAFLKGFVEGANSTWAGLKNDVL